ncbi:MAG: hypothetical protein QW343_01255 [Candidatus Norongarragalinales archaeon]
MRKLFLLAAVALALLSCSFAAAFTAEETARYYANAGESTATVNFTAAGARHVMVKINGAESIVLREEKSVWQAVENEAELEPLLREYLQQQFDAIGFASRAAAVKANFDVFRTEGERCIEAIKKLIRLSRATPPYYYITLNAGRDFPKEYAALQTLNATLPTFENAFNSSRDAVLTIENKVSLRDADAAINAFNEVSSGMNAFKAAYANVSAAHATIVATFPNAFLLQVDLKDHCVLNSNQTAAVDEVITQSFLGAIKSTPELAKQIALNTAARKPPAAARMLDAAQSAKIAELAELTTNVTKEYAAAAAVVGVNPVNLSVLWKQLGELRALHEQTRNATNDSSAFAAAFDHKARETSDKIAFFKAMLGDYSKSLVAVDNATREVDKVVKKYGTNDERVAALQKDLRSLQVLAKSYDDLLRDGMLSSVSYQAVTANATRLSERASTLAPKESQLDFVLIGGIVILVGAVAATFYYLRKKKQEGVIVLAPPQRPQSIQNPPY